MNITKKMVITQTLGSGLSQVLVMGINILVLPLFIRNLGADLYGIWVLSTVLLGYLNAFDFGFTQGLQKYVAEARVKKDQTELSEVVVSGVGLLFCIGLIFGLACWFGAESIAGFFKISPENKQVAVRLVQISALLSILMWPLRIVDVVLNACMRIKELSFLNAFKTGVQSIALLVMVHFSMDIVVIKWVASLIFVGCSIPGLWLVQKYVSGIQWSPRFFRFNQIRRMHRFSLGMFYISVLGLLISQVDMLIIGRVLTMRDVAAYAVAVKLVGLIEKSIGMLMVAVSPAAYSISAAKDLVKLEALVKHGIFYRTLISVLLCTVTILIAPAFIRLWVGGEYETVTFWAQIRCIVPLFTTMGVANVVARCAGHVKSANVVYSFQIILNVLLSLWLVNVFGVGGPILGTLLSVIIIGDFTMFPVFCRILGIGWKSTFVWVVKIQLLGVFMLGLGYLSLQWINLGSWLKLGTFSFCFGGITALLLVLLFLRTEIRELSTSMRRVR